MLEFPEARADRPRFKELEALYLRYLPLAAPLRARAVAQMIAKALFTSPYGTRITTTEVTTVLREWLGVPLPASEVLEGLKYLNSDRHWVAGTDGGWILTDEGRRCVQEEHEASHRRLDAVLARFPAAIPKDRLVAWFNATSVRFFERYGSQTVAALHRQPLEERRLPLRQLVTETAATCGLKEHVDALIEGYRDFIERPTQQEQTEIWCRWQAAFAARLIMANLGSDPITVDELCGATVLVDTNVLVTNMLDGRPGSANLQALSRVVEYLDIRVVVLPQTVEEYRGVVEWQRRQVMTLLNRLPVIALTRTDNPFVRTAIARGCRTADDFERFFASIRDVPSVIGDGVAVAVVQDEVILEAATEAERNAEIVSAIESAARGRVRGKGQRSVRHDAALVGAVEATRRANVKSWVLTEDGSMAGLAAKRASRRELPSWVHLSAVVQVLAIESGGPTLKAEEFGGLLSAIFEHDLQPGSSTYELEDMHIALEIEARCASLPPEAAQRIAMKVARSRLRGRDRDDPELQLTVAREFQREREALAKRLDAAVADAAIARDDLNSERRRLTRMSEAMTLAEERRLSRAAIDSFGRRTLFLLPFAVAAMLLAGWLAIDAPPTTAWSLVAGSVLTGGLAAVARLLREVRILRSEMAEARRRADARVAAMAQEPAGLVNRGAA